MVRRMCNYDAAGVGGGGAGSTQRVEARNGRVLLWPVIDSGRGPGEVRDISCTTQTHARETDWRRGAFGGMLGAALCLPMLCSHVVSDA